VNVVSGSTVFVMYVAVTRQSVAGSQTRVRLMWTAVMTDAATCAAAAAVVTSYCFTPVIRDAVDCVVSSSFTAHSVVLFLSLHTRCMLSRLRR